jgi:hypothetical protein
MMSFTAPDGRTLQWVLRSQLGSGPLALLALRGFTLPDQIFSVDSAANAQALMANTENSDMEESNNEHLQNLVAACQADETQLRNRRRHARKAGSPGLLRSATRPTGEDPGYDDDFQRIREEVNKLSGIDTGLICTLAEKLLTTTAKDIRIATYYCWARLHQDGEAGFAEGLELLAGLLQRYGRSFIRSGTKP